MKKQAYEIQKFVDFIIENPWIILFCVFSLVLLIFLDKLISKKPKLIITEFSRFTGIKTKGKVNKEDTKSNPSSPSSNISNDMFYKITLSIKNTSKKRVLNLRIKELNNKLKVITNLPEDLSIESNSIETVELEYIKSHFGKAEALKAPEFNKDIDLSKEFSKNEKIITLDFENLRGKKYSISHAFKKKTSK